jgi:hypothetical protein
MMAKNYEDALNLVRQMGWTTRATLKRYLYMTSNEAKSIIIELVDAGVVFESPKRPGLYLEVLNGGDENAE